MKYNYLGTILVACFIGSMLVVGGAQACKHYPFLTDWMGAGCWLNDSQDKVFNEAGTQNIALHIMDMAGVEPANGNADLSKEAIYALARTGTEDAATVLRALALTHASLEIRKAALYALAECLEDEALHKTYSDIAQYGDELELRVAAVHQLGQLDTDSAVPFLTDIALSPYPLSLRKAAVHALQTNDSDVARQALYNILSNTAAAFAG
ncbi:MAG: HEAT repeat domain-containing protein [Bacteroidota bacterium]